MAPQFPSTGDPPSPTLKNERGWYTAYTTSPFQTKIGDNSADLAGPRWANGLYEITYTGKGVAPKTANLYHAGSQYD